MAELFEQIGLFIEQIIGTLGYPGIFFASLLETIFPPIPSELIMPFGGFLVARGELTFVGVVISGTLGAVLGAIPIYYLGLWADERIIRRFIRKWGRFLTISEADLDRTMNFFMRYGEAVIFFGRLIPLIRTLISLPAGMKRMPMPKFLFFTTLGTALWSAILAYAGVLLGENWEDLLGFLKTYERIILVVVVLVVVVVVVLLVMRSIRSRRVTPDATPE